MTVSRTGKQRGTRAENWIKVNRKERDSNWMFSLYRFPTLSKRIKTCNISTKYPTRCKQLKWESYVKLKENNKRQNAQPTTSLQRQVGSVQLGLDVIQNPESMHTMLACRAWGRAEEREVGTDRCGKTICKAAPERDRKGWISLRSAYTP